MIKIISKIAKLFKVIILYGFDDSIKKLSKCDVLFFCNDVDRGITLNGRAYSPILDPIKEALESNGYTCLSVGYPSSRLTKNKGHSYVISINRSFLLNILKKEIFHNITNQMLYENIFSIASNSVVITIGAPVDLINAAKKKNVYQIEVLHGIGYTPLPWGWDKRDILDLPHAVFSLDSVSTKTFSELQKKGITVKEITHPFIVKYMNNRLPQEWLFSKNERLYKKEILVALQWGYGDDCSEPEFKYILSNGLFYNEIEDVIKLTNNEIYWRFRFHPVQLRQRKKYRKQFDFIKNIIKKYSNTEWEESSTKPLFSVLSTTSGLLTMNSMACYEASYFGIPSLALCPSLRDSRKYCNMFSDLEEQGYLIKHEVNTSYIINWARNIKKTKPNLINSNIIDFNISIDWISNIIGVKRNDCI